MSTIEKSPTRLAHIDALRGWAILMVIVGHCGVLTGMSGWKRTLADHSMMGVYLFFVISAFTIFYMLTKHAQTESRPVRNFFIRRIFRIAPLYWSAIIYYNLIWGTLEESQNWHYIFNFLFLNALHPEPQTSVVPGGWSISIEMLFYCAVPFLFGRIRNLSLATVFMLLCVFVFPAITYLLYHWINPTFAGLYPLMVHMFWERFPLISIGSFSFGIWLYFLIKDERVMSFFRGKALNLAVIVMVALMFWALAYLIVVYPPKTHFYSFVFMILMLMLCIHPWKFFVNRFTTFIGRISYSMYIVHVSVAVWLATLISQRFPSLSAQVEMYSFVLPISVIILSIPLAWCTYQCIERPAILFGQRWIARLENH